MTRRAAVGGLVSLVALPAFAQGSPGAGTALLNARLFTGSAMSAPSSLLIKDGRISAISAGAGPADLPQGVRRVDMAGRFLVPGLNSAHVHVGHVVGIESGIRFYTRDRVEEQLALYAAFGVTQVSALGMSPPLFHEIRRESQAGRLKGATLYGAGPGVGVTDGAPPAKVMNLSDEQVARPRTAAEASDVVDQLAEAGVDQIKLWIEDMNGQLPVMSPEIAKATADAAHRRNLPAVAHVHDVSHARLAINSGVDVLGHGVRDEEIDDAMLAAMKQGGVRYIPTIQIDEAEYIYVDRPELADDPFFKAAAPEAFRKRMADAAWRETQAKKGEKNRPSVEMNKRNLAKLHAAGITIGMGTDSGATPMRIPGFAEHRELALMVEAGLTPADALRIASEGSAAVYGQKDRGVLKVDAAADLVALDADPVADIANMRRIVSVWRAGEQIAGAPA
ncbi:amidohydrolase family protein [Chenggangzhangella methanolivorans]